MTVASSSPASGPASDKGQEPETLENLMRLRHSVRAFLGTPVPVDTIERILGMAQRTPSWCNTQPWHVTVTMGEETVRFRDALYEHAASHPPQPDFEFPPEYHGVYRRRRKEAGVALYQALGITREDRAASARQMRENFRLFGAPHVALITTDASLGVYGAIDCGLYVQSFLLAAQSLGVATVPQAAIAAHSSFVRAYFDLPESRRVVCGVSFGYRDPAHPANSFRTTRASLSESTVTWVGR